MKPITAIIITLFILSGCTNPQQKEQNSAQEQPEIFIKNIDATAFKKLVDAGNGIILDVRTPEEIADGYISNSSAINLYDEDFEEKIGLIAKDKEIYVYCKSGGRSSQAANILQKNGFNKIYNLNKGLIEWEANLFPLTKNKLEQDEHIQEINLNEFESLLNTDMPVLIDFHTVWCAPCRKMAPVIDKIEEDFKDKAIVMRIDVDKSKDVGKAYDISGVPVFILFMNGKAIWRHHGIVSEEELKKQIESNLKI